jgi:hypothetical protein
VAVVVRIVAQAKKSLILSIRPRRDMQTMGSIKMGGAVNGDSV